MNKKINTFWSGIIFAVINTISFGILGVIDKLGATHDLNPLHFSAQSTAWSLLFTTLFAAIFLGKNFLPTIRNTTASAWRNIIVVGILTSGLAILLRFWGLAQATGTFATLSQSITTSLTALFAMLFLKERLPKMFWVFFFLIVVATYFVSIGKLSFTPLQTGDIIIIAGAVLIAIANMFAKKAVEQASPVMLSLGRFVFGGLIVLPASLIFVQDHASLFTFSLWSLLSGIFWTSNVLAFGFAIKRIGITLTTTLIMLAPIITMILEYLFLKQTFNLIQLSAAFVVITSGVSMVMTKK